MKSIVLMTTFGSGAFADPAPDFNLLASDGLPQAFAEFYADHNLTFHQLVDMDGDGDNDAIFGCCNYQYYFLENAGNVVAPAFKQTAVLMDNPFGSAFFFKDINNNGIIDLVSYSVILSSPGKALAFLDIKNFRDGNISDHYPAVSFEDLVGAEEAERIGTLVNSDSAPLKFDDYDGDGDLDMEIFFDPGDAFHKTYKQTLRLENTGNINNVPVFVVNEINSNRSPAPRYHEAAAYEALYGIPNIGNSSLSELRDRVYQAELFASFNIGLSSFVDFIGDSKAELLLDPDLFDRLTNHSIDLTNISLYQYQTHSLHLFTENDVNISIIRGGQLLSADFNNDGERDFLILPGALHSPGVTVNNDNSQLYFFEKSSLRDKEGALCPNCPAVFNRQFSRRTLDVSGLSQFINTTLGSAFYTYAFVDIDVDGRPDLFVSRDDVYGQSSVRLFLNQGIDANGKLGFSSPMKNPFGLDFSSFRSIAQIDGDLDGDHDLIVSSTSFRGQYFENTGSDENPFFIKQTSLPFGLIDNKAVRLFDLEGDGDLDSVDSTGFGDIQINDQINTRDDQVAHISIRAFSEAGEGRVIGGFEVLGPLPQRVIIKGLGPSLAAFGVDKPLADPVLTLFEGQQAIKVNDDWQKAADGGDSIKGTPFAPAHPNEAALDLQLKPGVYTVHLTDRQGRAGIGIVSIDTPIYGYLDSPRPKQRSFRVQVGNGEDVAIAGFVVQDGPKQVVIHGIGPSLAADGVENPLDDPELLLFSGPKLVARNQSWQTLDNADLLRQNELAPGDDREAVIMQKLEPGTYTVHLRSERGGQGVGIIGVTTLNEK